MKSATSFRLSDEAIKILSAMCRKLGIGRGAVVELAIREYAKKAGKE